MNDRQWGAGWAAPAVVVLAVGFALPLIFTLVQGLPHLGWLIQNERLTVVNNGLWLAITVIGITAGSLLLTVWGERVRLIRPLTLVVLLPTGLTLAATAVAWRLVFAFRPDGRAQVGLVNELVTTVGVAPIPWLTQRPLLNTVVLCAALVWAGTGLALLMLTRALDAVPADLVRDARAQGFSEVRIFRRLMWPFLRRPLAGVALAAAVVGWRTHDLIRVATNGFFGTGVLATGSFERSFLAAQPGRGAALALALVIPAVLLGAVLYRFAWATPQPRVEPLRRGGRHSVVHHSDRRPQVRGTEIGRRLGMALLGLFALAWVLPLLGLVLTALRPAPAAAEGGWWRVFVDPSFTLDHLRDVLSGAGSVPGLFGALINSVVIAVPATALILVTALTSSYALNRGRFSGRGALRAALVIAVVIPVPAVLYPLFEGFDFLHLTGSWVGVWLAHLILGLPLAVFLLEPAVGRIGQHEEGVTPGEPGPLRRLWRVLPALTPTLIGVAGLVFLLVWSDYLVAVTFLTGDNGTNAPMTVTLAQLLAARGEEQHLVAAAALVTMVVPLAVLIGLRRSIAEVLFNRVASSPTPVNP